MKQLGMPTQGGGLCRWDHDRHTYVFVYNAPHPFINGSAVPRQWGVVPTWVEFDALNEEQIQNWRKALYAQFGIAALLVPNEWITTYRDRVQAMLDNNEKEREETLRKSQSALEKQIKKESAFSQRVSDLIKATLSALEES